MLLSRQRGELPVWSQSCAEREYTVHTFISPSPAENGGQDIDLVVLDGEVMDTSPVFAQMYTHCFSCVEPERVERA